MGDYTKLIVNCEVEYSGTEEELKDEIFNKLGGISSSAYHCEGELIQVRSEYPLAMSKKKNISIICQKKYGDRIEEFLDWLKPLITQGFGNAEYYAIVATEHFPPELYKLDNIESKQ